MPEELRITIPVARVLRALLEDPTAPQYGLEIMHVAGLASGSLYPILRRLEGVGWVESSWEELEPVDVGRPRRRYYGLTKLGAERARHALAELSQLGSPRSTAVLRPGSAGGAA